MTEARSGGSLRGLTIGDAFFALGAFTCSDPAPWQTSHPMLISFGIPSPSMSASPLGSFTALATKSPATVGVRLYPVKWHEAHSISKDFFFGGSASFFVPSLKSQSAWESLQG